MSSGWARRSPRPRSDEPGVAIDRQTATVSSNVRKTGGMAVITRVISGLFAGTRRFGRSRVSVRRWKSDVGRIAAAAADARQSPRRRRRSVWSVHYARTRCGRRLDPSASRDPVYIGGVIRCWRSSMGGKKKKQSRCTSTVLAVVVFVVVFFLSLISQFFFFFFLSLLLSIALIFISRFRSLRRTVHRGNSAVAAWAFRAIRRLTTTTAVN